MKSKSFSPVRMARDAASAPVVGVLVASAVLIAAFATAVSITANEARVTKGDAQQLKNVAQDALHLIVSDPGRTESGGSAWNTDPDGKTVATDRMERFGLASDRGRNFLSGEKIDALRLAKITSVVDNGHPDYPEVRTALGLDDYNFHLRSYPIVYSVDDPRFNKFRGMDVAYIGHYTGSVEMPAVTVTVTHTPSSAGDHVLVKFKITCTTAGQADVHPDIFRVDTQLKTGNGASFTTIVQSTFSPVIDCGAAGSPQWGTVVVRYERIAWSTSKVELKYNVHSLKKNDDVYNSFQEYTGFPKSHAGSESYTLLADMSDGNYHDTTPTVRLDKFDKEQRYGSIVRVDITVTPPSGPAVNYDDVDIPAGAALDYALAGLTATASLQAFNITVTSDDGTTAKQFGHFTYTTTDPGMPPPAGIAATPSTAREQDIMNELVERFVDTPYEVSGGDIYRDVQNELKQVLFGAGDKINLGRDGVADSGDEYDILVIGSSVDPNDLTPNAVKDGIEDFVKVKGNTLIMLGATESNTNWLKTAFNVEDVGGAGNGLSSPDETHPSLTSPEQLNWRSYNSGGRSYKVAAADYDGWTHVVIDSADEENDVLVISNPGTFGKGTVILASFIPFSMGGGEGEDKRFLNNMLTQSLRQMLIDYGPPIPSGVPVGSASRVAVVPHPHDPLLMVELRLIFYVWK